MYCDILEGTLLPFIAQKFPSPMEHRFMQDIHLKQLRNFLQDGM